MTYFDSNPNAKLVFLHLPKTAGTSLTQPLCSQFDEARICPARTSGELNSITASDRMSYSFYAGHLSFSDFDDCNDPIEFITVLRDPFERVLSNYLFWQQTANAYDKLGEKRPDHLKNILELPAIEYLHENWGAPLHNQLDNLYMHFFSFGSYSSYKNVVDMKRSDDYMPEALVDKALSNIKNRVSVTGFTEKLDQFIDSVSERYSFQLHNIEIPTKQVTKRKNGESKLEVLTNQHRGDESIAFFKENSKFDKEIYAEMGSYGDVYQNTFIKDELVKATV